MAEKCVENRKCIIVGAGSFQGMAIRPQPGDLVIAADGGFDHLQKEGIRPDVLMGDFDSIERQPEHEHLIRFSPIKDDTDMALAAAYGSEQGYDTFLIYGGLGGRLDHTLANLQMMTGLSRQGKAVYLIGEGVILTAITSERISFDESCQGMISVFCLGEPATGVTERGLKYALEDSVLTCDRALGVSNEFTGVRSSIEGKEGTLVILWDEANGLPKRRPL
jgi:thiamine pyrophosphokinase